MTFCDGLDGGDDDSVCSWVISKVRLVANLARLLTPSRLFACESFKVALPFLCTSTAPTSAQVLLPESQSQAKYVEPPVGCRMLLNVACNVLAGWLKSLGSLSENVTEPMLLAAGLRLVWGVVLLPRAISKMPPPIMMSSRMMPITA